MKHLQLKPDFQQISFRYWHILSLITYRYPMTIKNHTHSKKADAQYVLQKVQPALLGLMDGSVSTLAPIFAAAGLTGQPMKAFFVGLAASLGAGISMGLAEALSDDGKVTGRGSPIIRGG